MVDNINNNDVTHCSNCGAEISKYDEKCEKCGAEQNSGTEKDDNQNTVVIKTFMNEFEAEIARGVLEDEGVESFISKDDEGSMYPSLRLTEGVRLHIFEKDIDKANDILNSLDSGENLNTEGS